jgi:hypothetical protein
MKCLTVGCGNEATYITTLGERCEKCTMKMKDSWGGIHNKQLEQSGQGVE